MKSELKKHKFQNNVKCISLQTTKNIFKAPSKDFSANKWRVTSVSLNNDV